MCAAILFQLPSIALADAVVLGNEFSTNVLDEVNDTLSVASNTNLEGIYYFKNRETGRYMQPDNNGKTFMEQHNYSGNDQQKWQLIYDSSSGYYKIMNYYSGLYLTSPNSSAANESIVEQSYSTTTASRQLWSITYVNGSYKIQSQAGEANNLVLAVGAGLNVNGVNIEQRTYTSDSSYRDEWLLEVYNVTMFGIEATGHDHSSAISYVNNLIQQTIFPNTSVYLGAAGEYSGIILGGDKFTSSNYDSNLRSSSIFLSRSHGICMADSNGKIYSTGVDLQNPCLNRYVFYSHTFSTTSPSPDWTFMSSSKDYYKKCDLVLFIACSTAAGGENGKNLVAKIVDSGAKTSIGFEDTVGCNAANLWTKYFFDALLNGYTVYEAVEAVEQQLGTANGLGSICICGDDSYTIPN